MNEELILNDNAGNTWSLPLARLIYAESKPNEIRLRFPLYLVEIKLESQPIIMPINIPTSSRDLLESIFEGRLPRVSVRADAKNRHWEAGEVAAITVQCIFNKPTKKEQL